VLEESRRWDLYSILPLNLLSILKAKKRWIPSIDIVERALIRIEVRRQEKKRKKKEKSTVPDRADQFAFRHWLRSASEFLITFTSLACRRYRCILLSFGGAVTDISYWTVYSSVLLFNFLLFANLFEFYFFFMSPTASHTTSPLLMVVRGSQRCSRAVASSRRSFGTFRRWQFRNTIRRSFTVEELEHKQDSMSNKRARNIGWKTN
jgi:hypothetical protein